jgi:hypothetical protein
MTQVSSKQESDSKKHLMCVPLLPDGPAVQFFKSRQGAQKKEVTEKVNQAKEKVIEEEKEKEKEKANDPSANKAEHD